MLKLIVSNGQLSINDGNIVLSKWVSESYYGKVVILDSNGIVVAYQKVSAANPIETQVGERTSAADVIGDIGANFKSGAFLGYYQSVMTGSTLDIVEKEGLWYYKNYGIGLSDADIQIKKTQIATFDGTAYLECDYDLDLYGITITSFTGTSTPSINGTAIEFTAGTAEYLKLSNGAEYWFQESDGVEVYNRNGDKVGIFTAVSGNGSLNVTSQLLPIGTSISVEATPDAEHELDRVDITDAGGLTQITTESFNWVIDSATSMVAYFQAFAVNLFTTTQEATNIQIPLKLKIELGKTVYIDWGNGDIVEAVGTGGEQTYTSNYSTIGNYNVLLSGDFEYITSINITGSNAIMNVTAGIAEWEKMIRLDTLHLQNLPNFTSTGVHADIPRVTSTLTLYNLPNFTSTGVHSDLPRVTNTLYLYNLPNFASTGVHADMPRVTGSLYLWNLPNFTSTGVHADIPRVTSTLYLITIPNFTSTGVHADIPRVTGNLYLTTLPNFTSTGNISDLPNVNGIISISSSPLIQLTVDIPPSWTTATIMLQVGWLTSEVNQFVINWAPVTGSSLKNVNIAGNNEALTTTDPNVAAAMSVLEDKLKILIYN